MNRQIDNNLLDWGNLENRYEWSSILIGNGFSQNIWQPFRYDSLFNKASQDDDEGEKYLSGTDIALFKKFSTDNFETVLGALATSRSVSTVLELPCKKIEQREKIIRKALARAVHRVHIFQSDIPSLTLESISDEFKNYNQIYSTNYDLLIYWSMMHGGKNNFRDYFWYSGFNNTEKENLQDRSAVYYLHGGLHLYLRPDGQTLKRTARPGRTLLGIIGDSYRRGAIPLIVAEGTSQNKMKSIESSDYLSFAYRSLILDKKPLVVFGHSLGSSDQHIVEAINVWENRPVAVSVVANDDADRKMRKIRNRLKSPNISFFNAVSHPLGAEDLRVEEGFA